MNIKTHIEIYFTSIDGIFYKKKFQNINTVLYETWIDLNCNGVN